MTAMRVKAAQLRADAVINFSCEKATASGAGCLVCRGDLVTFATP